ncbi:MAG: hypothetical protein IH881_17280 [Myxococcales bacterium]|nr:hypothetical protein [Myxococcales bacterium]
MRHAKGRRSMLTRSILILCCTFLSGPAGAGILDDLIHAEGAPEILDRVHISGYANAHYMNHLGVARLVTDDKKLEDLNDGFVQLREFSFFIDIGVFDYLTVSSEIEFADDFSEVGANYLYGDLALSELLPFWDEDELGQLTLRGGKFLIPFLSYNENKPNFKQYLMSQPFTAWNVVPVIGTPIATSSFGWSDTGFLFNFARSISSFGIIDFKVAMINGIESNAAVLDSNAIVIDAGMMTPTVRPRDGLMQNKGPSWKANRNGELAAVGKVSFMTNCFPLDVGFFFYSGKWDPDGKRGLFMYGFHANWISRNWTLRGEWVQAQVEQVAGTNLYGMPASINMSTGDYNMEAWYLEGSIIPCRFGPGDKLYVRLIGRYDEVNTNNKALFTPFHRRRWTLGSEFEFFSNARLRFEWQHHRIVNFKEAPGPYLAAGGKRAVQMLMGSVIYSF